MQSNTELVQLTCEAIENAASNGYPTDNLTDLKLAEDLWLQADFVENYDIEFIEELVIAAREKIHHEH